MSSNFDLSKLLAKTPDLTVTQKINYVWKLSVPGIIAQISSILMQYIDAAMVGQLGTESSAAIGLIASSTWIMGSLSHALTIGFTVQVAQAVGAGKQSEAKKIFLQSLYTCVLFALVLLTGAVSLSRGLPLWLGATGTLASEATGYFFIYALAAPFFMLVYLMTGMLQCIGNMKLPAILNAAMCFLDVLFNWIFIFGCHMGVRGAALGTGVSAVVVALILGIYTVFCCDYLKLTGLSGFGADFRCIRKAFAIGTPIGVESSAFTGALIIVAKMISPLGSVAIAANSFATTAEALCYMGGYGIQEAAVSLVGQSVGARRKDLTRSFSIITVLFGMGLMTVTAILMWFICPLVFRFLTPDPAVQLLATKVLRIELFCEPLYAAAIVSSGALRGKGDTLVPGILALFSLWVVRLGLTWLLIGPYGLVGVWIAMTAELCFRGLVLLARLFLHKSTSN